MNSHSTIEKDLSLFTHFAGLRDPRSEQGKLHKFFDMVAIAITAILCGSDSWVAVEEFGRAQILWYQSFLELPNGIPSHDAFNDIFRRIDPEKFQELFIKWTQEIASVYFDDIVAIDGKTVRRSASKGKGIKALHCVSAFSTANNLILGQIKTDKKSNEITAIPELLKQLALKGCIVTIDAMGCQTEIAKTIKDAGADYVLSVKDNQPTTLDDIEDCFNQAEAQEFEEVKYCEEISLEEDHGRVEKRTVQAIPASYCPDLAKKWFQVQSIVRIIRERQVKGKKKKGKEVVYYLSSLAYDHPKLLKAPRDHWGIENRVHWILDVGFREDDCRIREGYGAENFSTIRRLTLNLLKRDSSKKVGIAIKRCIAGWDVNYRERLLKMV